ncbi:RNA polymerase sigma factor [Sorangium cellulosum]|uniref:RNA polymerase sigma factor n=1 Tax=Sorangium cellulosum TaxID=56 RepID=UPI001F1B1892|nr:sigma-70 family RNA polymerase sigma factor [Sorangium cellulosum]
MRVPFDAIMRESGMLRTVLRQLAVPAGDQPDLMQEILLSAWRSVEAGRFQPYQHVPVKKVLRCWLSAIAWHHVIHYRERVNRWHKARAACATPENAPSSFGQVEARMALRCLERLKPELRAVLAGTAFGYTAEAELGAHPAPRTSGCTAAEGSCGSSSAKRGAE